MWEPKIKLGSCCRFCGKPINDGTSYVALKKKGVKGATFLHVECARQQGRVKA